MVEGAQEAGREVVVKVLAEEGPLEATAGVRSSKPQIGIDERLDCSGCCRSNLEYDPLHPRN